MGSKNRPKGKGPRKGYDKGGGKGKRKGKFGKEKPWQQHLLEEGLKKRMMKIITIQDYF